MVSQAEHAARFERLLVRVPIAGCWIWLAALDRDGYGLFKIGGRMVRAHRYAYKVAGRYLRAGRPVDHLCRVRCCVNPAHLEAVSNRVNTLRGQGPAAINAAKTHCAKGHPFTAGNVYNRKTERERVCKTCSNARSKIAYLKRKGKQ